MRRGDPPARAHVIEFISLREPILAPVKPSKGLADIVEFGIAKVLHDA